VKYRSRSPSAPTFYRLLVPLPLTVSFPSVTYEVSLQSVPAAGRHELVAHAAETGVWPFLSPRYHAREFLEQAVFQSGFPVRPASIGEVIMRRLVREKRAEIVPVPVDDLTERRPAARQHLGTWLNVHLGDPVQ
jgi:hypothetical protein